jgi:integrase
MNNLVPVGSPQSPGTLLPVAIDYPAALALRQMALVQDELPKYLLAPEVSALLHYVPDLHRKMLLATLWNTGARINEALALTRGIFRWRRRIRSCSWPRSSSAPRKRQNGRSSSRRQPGSSPGSAFRSPLRQPAADDGGHPENSAGKTKQAHRQNGEARIWEITDRTVRTWLSEAVEAAAADGVTFSVPVTPIRSVTPTRCICCMPAYH